MSDSTAQVDRAVESRGSAFVTKYIMPLMVAALGFYLVADRTEARQASARIEAVQQSQGADLAQVKSDIRDLNTRLDAGLIRQVDSNTKRIDDHEARLQRIERAVRTP